MFLPVLLFLYLPAPVVPEEPPLPAPVVQTITAEVTAYSSSVDETDDTPNLNAAGTRPDHGSIACPRYYELGTEFIIEGIHYTCDDRMARRFPDRFDIWMESKEKALEHGVKTMEVQVVKP